MKRIEYAAHVAVRSPKAKAPKAAAKKPDPIAKFYARIDRSGGKNACHLWIGAVPSNKQYASIHFNGKPQRVHRIAWSLANGYMPESTDCVLHRCNTPLCCNPDHLYLGTRKQNAADAIRAGTHGVRKLNASMARDIATFKGKATARDVSIVYGVTPNTIDRIWLGFRWAKATGIRLDQPKPAARKSRAGVQVEAALQ